MRTLRLIGLLFVITLCLCMHAYANDNYPDRKAIILNICPYVELSGFSFANVEFGDKFQQDMSWKNIGNQPLVAFEIVTLKYDAFNRRMIGSRWIVSGKNSIDWNPLEPGNSGKDGTRSFGEEEVFTGIAYVRIARLKDGTIWRVDDAKLLEQLNKAAPEIQEFGDVKPDPKPKPN